MGDYFDHFATTEQACDTMRVQTDGAMWTLEELLAFGLTPFFWAENPDDPLAFLRRKQQGNWICIVFTDGERKLEVQGKYVLVRTYTRDDGAVVSVEGGLRVPLPDLRFPWTQLEDPWKTADWPIELVQVNPQEQAATPPEAVFPLKQQRQEQRILEILRSLGFDPQSLPQRPAGKRGVKSTVKAVARDEPRLFTAKTFDTAWERLRDDGSLVGGD
jgi:hypothetical protein